MLDSPLDPAPRHQHAIDGKAKATASSFSTSTTYKPSILNPKS